MINLQKISEDWLNEAVLLISIGLLLSAFFLSQLLLIKIICVISVIIILLFVFIRFRDKKVDLRIDEVKQSYVDRSKNVKKRNKNVFDDVGGFQENFDDENFDSNFIVADESVKEETKIVELPELIPDEKPHELKVEVVENKIIERKPSSVEIENIFVDGNQSLLNPKQELQKILQRVVEFIHSLTFANSVALFWIKNNSKNLSLESLKTNSKNFLNQKNFSISDDVIARVIKNKKGIFEKNINGIELPFYENEKICSLIAIPILYDEDSPIALLMIDSLDEDAFGEENISTIIESGKLIADLFVAESDKLALWDDKKYFNVHTKMLELLRMQSDVSHFINTFVDKISEIIFWDSLAIVMYNSELGAWEVVNTRSRLPGKYYVVKQTIDLKSSLVGSSILENVIKISEDEKIVRLMENENELGISRGKIISSIPISTNSKCYGAFIIEREKQNQFTNEELQNIQRILTTVASVIELQDANEIISQHVIYDEIPNVVTKKHFIHRLDEEVKRANDLNLDLTLALFAIHTAEEIETRFNKDAVTKVMTSLSNFLVGHKRNYDLIGRIESNILGVMLVQTPANEAYLWGEKIRSSIAENKIKIENKQFSAPVTVSICGLKNDMIVDDLVTASREVLDKAIRVGGNLVSVY